MIARGGSGGKALIDVSVEKIRQLRKIDIQMLTIGVHSTVVERKEDERKAPNATSIAYR